jgi:2-polyprenyl-3-methyl-5-hydroxy-6-metoxy-1,4-benzoquinol methylase
MIKLKECPICSSEKLTCFMESFDYSVSKEAFIIDECVECNFLFTNPRPNEEDMSSYYISENYISHTDNKIGLFNFLYQTVRKYAIKSKTRLLTKTTKTKRHLDIGCGTGEFLYSCVNQGIECYGIEPSKIAREKAKQNYGLNVTENTDLSQFETNTFDSVSMWHVLEHLYDLNSIIKKTSNIITKNGRVIIAVPNHGSLDAKLYKKWWAAWDLPIHLNHFSALNIEMLLKNYDFILEKKIGMKFDSFYVSLLSNQYKSGKKQYLKGFTIGLLSNISALLGLTEYSSTIYIFKNKKQS